MGRTAGSQCAPRNFWPGDDQAVRCPSRLCDLARSDDGLNRASGAPRCFLLGQPYSSEGDPSFLFSWLFSLALHSFISVILTRFISRFARHSLMRVVNELCNHTDGTWGL